jgi:beta-galactosidase
MEIPSSLDIGEHPAGDLGAIYAFTNCDHIKLYKNDELIKVFYPDKKQFPHITHPPIKIDDLIGDQLQKNEGITEKDSAKFKKVLKDTSKYGLNLPIGSKLMMGRLMLKYKLSMEDGIKIFGKYISNWGGQRVTFKFEGYKDGQLVKTVIKAPAVTSRLEVKPDSIRLTEKETYDVTRIVIRAVDEYGNLLVYSNDSVVINVDGPIELIGPQCISLIGGARAFWVKSRGKSGVGTVKINSEKYGNQKIEIHIEKIRPTT